MLKVMKERNREKAYFWGGGNNRVDGLRIQPNTPFVIVHTGTLYTP